MNLQVIKNWFFIFSLVFAFIFLISCNKEDTFDCIKTSGKQVQEIIETDVFHSINVEDNINIVLDQEEEQRVLIKTGRNVLPKIKFEVKEQVLYISNENKCNWVRKFENPTVTISLKDLRHINHNGHGIISSNTKLVLETLNIDNFNGNGDIALDLDVENLNVFSKTFALISLSGRVSNLDVYYVHNYGKFYGEKLQAENVVVSHVGLNTIRVFPVKTLQGTVSMNGNIEYYNEPEVIDLQITGKGKLVKRF